MRSEETTYQYIIPLYNFAQTPHTFYLPQGYKRIKSIYAVPCNMVEEFTLLSSDRFDPISMSVDSRELLSLPINLLISPQLKPLGFNKIKLNHKIDKGKVVFNYHRKNPSTYIVLELDNVEEYENSMYGFKEISSIGGGYIHSEGTFNFGTTNLLSNDIVQKIWFNIAPIEISKFEDLWNLSDDADKLLKHIKKETRFNLEIDGLTIPNNRLAFHVNIANISTCNIEKIDVNSRNIRVRSFCKPPGYPFSSALYELHFHRLQLIYKTIII